MFCFSGLYLSSRSAARTLNWSYIHVLNISSQNKVKRHIVDPDSVVSVTELTLNEDPVDSQNGNSNITNATNWKIMESITDGRSKGFYVDMDSTSFIYKV